MASESSSHTLYAQLVSKAQSHEHESELYELAQLAGVTMDPEVFKIILDLLEMKCSPKAIADVIKSMLKHSAHNTSEFGQGDQKSHSSIDQSRLDNITIRSSSGGSDRRSRSPATCASMTRNSSGLHSLQDSSTHSSRGERKSRHKFN